LTIDVGTSSTRAILFDANAQVIEGMVEHRQSQMTTTPDGGATFDAEEVMAGTVAVIDAILARAGSLAEKIGAVAVDTLVGNVLGVDKAGKAVTPLFTYADTRNAAATQALRVELGKQGAEAAHQRTGCLIHTSYLPSRMRWLAQDERQWFNAASQWVSVGEYIYYRLFGSWRVSYSVAAWSGLLNRRDLTWDAEWLSPCLFQESNCRHSRIYQRRLKGYRENGHGVGPHWRTSHGSCRLVMARQPILAPAVTPRIALP